MSLKSAQPLTVRAAISELRPGSGFHGQGLCEGQVPGGRENMYLCRREGEGCVLWEEPGGQEACTGLGAAGGGARPRPRP